MQQEPNYIFKLTQIFGSLCIDPTIETSHTSVINMSNSSTDIVQHLNDTRCSLDVFNHLFDDQENWVDDDTVKLETERLSSDTSVSLYSSKTYQYSVINDKHERDPLYFTLIVNHKYKRTYVIDYSKSRTNLSIAKTVDVIIKSLPYIKDDMDKLGLNHLNTRIVVLSAQESDHRRISKRGQTFKSILDKLYENTPLGLKPLLHSLLMIDDTLTHSFIPRRARILALRILPSNVVDIGQSLELTRDDIAMIKRTDPLMNQVGIGYGAMVYIMTLLDSEQGCTVCPEYFTITL